MLFYQSFMYYSYCAYNITFSEQSDRAALSCLRIASHHTHTHSIRLVVRGPAESYSTIWCKEPIQPNACHSHSSQHMCLEMENYRRNGKFITCQAQNVKYHSYINRSIHLMHFSMDFPPFAFR